jgi:hypothetical protein
MEHLGNPVQRQYSFSSWANRATLTSWALQFVWYSLDTQSTLEISILIDSSVPLLTPVQNYATNVGDLLDYINLRYFRVRSYDATSTATYGPGCRAERLRREKLGVRATDLRQEDGTDLHERCRICSIARDREQTFTVVLGSFPIPNEVLRPETYPRVTTNYNSLAGEMQMARITVDGTENSRNPLMARYTSVEQVDLLDKIPEIPDPSFSFDQKLKKLAHGVDSGDLYTTLEALQSFGDNPPRLCNILTSAHLSSVTNSVQFVGSNTSDKWYQATDGVDGEEKEGMDGEEKERRVIGEQRVFSLPGLAWRRRHYFVFHALQKFESYAKSGMLRYMFSERSVRERTMRNTPGLTDLPEGPLQIIVGYMTPFFPHPMDMESIMMEDHGQAFGDRSKLVAGNVLSEAATNITFDDEVIRQALGGQLIPNGSVFDPYNAPTISRDQRCNILQ